MSFLVFFVLVTIYEIGKEAKKNKIEKSRRRLQQKMFRIKNCSWYSIPTSVRALTIVNVLTIIKYISNASSSICICLFPCNHYDTPDQIKAVIKA